VRRRRTGVGDNGLEASLQCRVAQTLGVALTGYRSLYNLLSNRVSGRGYHSFGFLKGDNGHFESDAHETNRLGIKPAPLQVGSDWHGRQKI